MNLLLKRIVQYTLITMVTVQLLMFVFSDFNWDQINTLKSWILQLFTCFVLTASNFTFYYFLDKKFSWEEEGYKKIVVGILGVTIVTMLGFLFCRFLTIVVIEKEKEIHSFWKEESLNHYFFPFLFTILITLIFYVISFYKALQEQKVEEQKIIAGTASAKYDALKNQLDPHFLFNSLNVLTALIGENPKMAEKFTTSLSKVYRYVLEQKNKNLVSVDEELRFAKTYVSLLQMRFEDSIFLNIPESAFNPEAKVVPLSLQILLENTVKHNVVMTEKPLHIKIYEEDGFLVVENNLQIKEVLKESTGVGLANVKQRYQLLSKRAFTVQKTKSSFIAKLPILTKQITMVTDSEPAYKKDDVKYLNAKEKVKEIKDFYNNFTAYCVVVPSLAILNFVTSPGYLWFLWTAFGWGIGVAIHAISVFGKQKFFGKDWEERKIKEFMKEK